MEQALLLIFWFLRIYMLCFFIWALLSWIPQFSPQLAYHPIVSSVRRFLDSIILPYVKLFSFLKPMQMGSMMFDMSSLVAFLTLIVVANYVFPAIAASVIGYMMVSRHISLVVATRRLQKSHIRFERSQP